MRKYMLMGLSGIVVIPLLLVIVVFLFGVMFVAQVLVSPLFIAGLFSKRLCAFMVGKVLIVQSNVARNFTRRVVRKAMTSSSGMPPRV